MSTYKPPKPLELINRLIDDIEQKGRPKKFIDLTDFGIEDVNEPVRASHKNPKIGEIDIILLQIQAILYREYIRWGNYLLDAVNSGAIQLHDINETNNILNVLIQEFGGACQIEVFIFSKFIAAAMGEDGDNIIVNQEGQYEYITSPFFIFEEDISSPRLIHQNILPDRLEIREPAY